MKLEIKCLIYGIINNIIICLIKFIGGLFFNLASMISDAIHTLSSVIVDTICLIGVLISRKKPTKYHPYGFGKIQYLTDLFVGLLVFCLGVSSIINAFMHNKTIPNISVIYLLIIVIILKITSLIIINKVGKKRESQFLVTSINTSKTDFFATAIVLISVILLQYSNVIIALKYVDIIGSVLIGSFIIYEAIKLIIISSYSLIGETEDEYEKEEELKSFILDNKNIEDIKLSLIKYGHYYYLTLFLKLKRNLTLRQILNIEKKLKKEIVRHYSFKIKYVTISITNTL